MMSYEDAVFEVFCWRKSNSGCFHNRLFDLISKADLSNRQLISKGFPNEVKAFWDWQHAQDEMQFFKEKGVIK